MKPCDEQNVNLLRYVGNDLGAQELNTFSAHLKTCAYCKNRLEQERALSQSLRASRPLYAAPTELRIRVSAAIEQHSPRHRSQWNWSQIASPLILNWKTLVPAALVISLCLIAVPNIVQNVRAANYVETAIANHNRYMNAKLTSGVRSNSPEAITAWFANKVPFQFRLPSSEAALAAIPTYKLIGASLVEYRGVPAAMVVYEAPSGIISLMIESSKAAIVAGGEEIRYGTLTFHYRNEGRLKVITWSVHNLSYALVSSIASSAQESCMVCHQNMTDHGTFEHSHRTASHYSHGT
jgi:anti-sigma factor RsiW